MILPAIFNSGGFLNSSCRGSCEVTPLKEDLGEMTRVSSLADSGRLGGGDFQLITLADVLGDGGPGSCEVSAFHLPDDDGGLLLGMATLVATVALSRFNDDDDLLRI